MSTGVQDPKDGQQQASDLLFGFADCFPRAPQT
jgi:hypothetical protein